MADYSTASQAAIDALNSAADGGLVEEYEVGANSSRVKRGRPVDQVKAALLLEGMANRRANGMTRLAKFRTPRA